MPGLKATAPGAGVVTALLLMTTVIGKLALTDPPVVLPVTETVLV